MAGEATPRTNTITKLPVEILGSGLTTGRRVADIGFGVGGHLFRPTRSRPISSIDMEALRRNNPNMAEHQAIHNRNLGHISIAGYFTSAERSAEMQEAMALSLAKIAQAAGFADQTRAVEIRPLVKEVDTKDRKLMTGMDQSAQLLYGAFQTIGIRAALNSDPVIIAEADSRAAATVATWGNIAEVIPPFERQMGEGTVPVAAMLLAEPHRAHAVFGEHSFRDGALLEADQSILRRLGRDPTNPMLNVLEAPPLGDGGAAGFVG
jgi:hypothetical protein